MVSCGASWAFPLGLGPVPWEGAQVSVPPSSGPSVSLLFSEGEPVWEPEMLNPSPPLSVYKPT